MAGAYLFHLCRNHPFADGNKRTALASALLFLDANGYTIKASNNEIEELVLKTARTDMDKNEVTAFFKERIKAK